MKANYIYGIKLVSYDDIERLINVGLAEFDGRGEFSDIEDYFYNNAINDIYDSPSLDVVDYFKTVPGFSFIIKPHSKYNADDEEVYFGIVAPFNLNGNRIHIPGHLKRKLKEALSKSECFLSHNLEYKCMLKTCACCN